MIDPERLLDIHLETTDIKGRHQRPGIDYSPITLNTIPGRTDYKTDLQALDELNENRESTMNLANYIRLGFSPEPLTLGKLRILTTGLYSAPFYAVLRKDNPIPTTQIPTSLIDVSRLGAGIAFVANVMAAENYDLRQPADPKEILEFANGNNHDHLNLFVTQDKRQISCPLEDRVIEPIIKGLINYPDLAIDPNLFDWGPHLSGRDIPRILTFGPAYYWLTTAANTETDVTEEEIVQKCRDAILSLGYLL
ncbi:MAG TPA: hypothetical protein VG917_02215 [Patescibacteria group bacterium]|nr:hypothetical protein [Patescibacteria group bacterium]